MPRVPGSVPAPSAHLYEAFVADLEASGRERVLSATGARRFLVRWPEPSGWADRPLRERLRGDGHARPFVLFLMLHRHLRPGYDFLVRRKFPSIWREAARSPIGPELGRFLSGAAELGFTYRTRLAIGSQVIARLLDSDRKGPRRPRRGGLRLPRRGVPAARARGGRRMAPLRQGDPVRPRHSLPPGRADRGPEQPGGAVPPELRAPHGGRP